LQPVRLVNSLRMNYLSPQMTKDQAQKLAVKARYALLASWERAFRPKAIDLWDMALVIVERRNWSKARFAGLMGMDASAWIGPDQPVWQKAAKSSLKRRLIWMMWAVELDGNLLRDDLFFFSWGKAYRKGDQAWSIPQYVDPDLQAQRNNSPA
jgi:hypothetical protein